MYGSYTAKLAEVTLATLVLFSSLTCADLEKRHVQLVSPKPFSWDEYGPTNPLNPDGSDYPCKIPQGDAFTIDGVATEIAVGEEQQVSFSGFAVHGGGSCQLALTEGHAPTKDSAWKVIHSIEGGCPKANVTGNLEEGQDPDTYTFTIPEDFEPGNFTWAWTWVNRIAASPEFYMNCAPITVTAAAGSTERVRARRRKGNASRATTYPDLFLANIGSASSGCDTSEAVYSQAAIAYPNPGSSVSYPNGQGDLFAQKCDGNPRNNGAAASSGGSQPSATGTTASGSAGATATSSLASSPADASETSTSLLLPATSSVASSSSILVSTTSSSLAATSSTATAASSTSTAGTSLDSPCTDGYLLCVAGTQFSTCTGGEWDAPQNLAANTTCEEDGPSVGLITTYHWD